jgi:hypothetical protein
LRQHSYPKSARQNSFVPWEARDAVERGFIGELVKIRQAEKALDVIRSLSHDIRDASTQLNRLIGNIRPPGA